MRKKNKLVKLKRINKIIKNTDVISDFITSICGEYLGSGTYRDVYVYNLNPSYVIKIERENTQCNNAEYFLWDEIKGLINNLEWVKDWFAPITWISPNGRILIMKRTRRKPKNNTFKKPDKIPAFLSDVKPSNFGWIGNKYMCHDYAFFYTMIHYSSKMRKINWIY